jgi:hypothetical protein
MSLRIRKNRQQNLSKERQQEILKDLIEQRFIQIKNEVEQFNDFLLQVLNNNRFKLTPAEVIESFGKDAGELNTIRAELLNAVNKITLEDE